MKGIRPFFGALCVAALAACSADLPIMDAGEPAFARAPTSTASLADGLQTNATYPAKVYTTETGFRLDAQDVTVTRNLNDTAIAPESACTAGDYGSDAATRTALLAKLTTGVSEAYTLVVNVAGSSGWIVMRWADSEGDFFVRFGVTINAPSADPSVTVSGNTYTYSGGTVYVLRTAGVKGNKTNPQTKRDMVCPNLDQVVLTFPAS